MTWLLVVAASLIVGWFIASFFPSYVSQKGKNLATKEDIREITAKIEEVKAALGSRLHIGWVFSGLLGDYARIGARFVGMRGRFSTSSFEVVATVDAYRGRRGWRNDRRCECCVLASRAASFVRICQSPVAPASERWSQPLAGGPAGNSDRRRDT